MKIYYWYIIKNIIPVFLLVTFSTILIGWLGKILKLVPLLSKSINFTGFIHLSILMMPFLLFIMLPITYYISVMYVYNKLQKEQELVIMLNAGLNSRQIAMPALFLATIFMIINYFISFYLLPLSYSSLKYNIRMLKEKLVFGSIKSQVFNSLPNNMVIYVDQKHSNNSFDKVILFEKQSDKPMSVTLAKHAHVDFCDDEIQLTLYDGIHQSYDDSNQLSNLNFNHLFISSLIKQRNSKSFKKDIQEYYFSELWSLRSSIDQDFLHKINVEIHQRILWPFYTLLITSLSLTIFFRSQYNCRSNNKIIIKTLLVVLIILLLHFAANNLSLKFRFYILFLYFTIFVSFIMSILCMQRRRL